MLRYKSPPAPPDGPQMIPRWAEKNVKQIVKKVGNKSEQFREKKSTDGLQMVPRWSLDGQNKIKTKIEKKSPDDPQMIPG